MKNHRILIFFGALLFALMCDAQIGYQVALMDQSTGMPRANETVTVTVKITDNAGTEICSSTQSATTNDFGMLSLQVGDADSFNNTDWSKLPLWVSATVGGVTIGKSQILNTPVAEHAKYWGVLTKEILTSKEWVWYKDWSDYGRKHIFHFYEDWTCRYEENEWTTQWLTCDKKYTGTYFIDGNKVVLILTGEDEIGKIGMFQPEKQVLIDEERCIFR